MRGKIVLAGLVLSLSGGFAAAQINRSFRGPNDSIARDWSPRSPSRRHLRHYGRESNYKITFNEGDYVYINKGSDRE